MFKPLRPSIVSRFIKPVFKPKYLGANTHANNPNNMININDLDNHKPIPIHVRTSIIPWFGTSVLERDIPVTLNDICSNLVLPSGLFSLVTGLFAVSAWDRSEIDYIFGSSFCLGSTTFMFASICQNIYDIKHNSNVYIEEFDKPVLLIDNWKNQAPYLTPLSILELHKNVHFISTNGYEDKAFDDEAQFNIKQFLVVHSHCKFSNMPWLQYLNKEQRTRFIDWYIRKNYSKTGAVVSSINYKLDYLYDQGIGCNKVSRVEKLHNGVIEECFEGEVLIGSNGCFDVGTGTGTGTCTGPRVVKESDIDKMKSHVTLVDFMENYFDYTNLGKNPIIKKLPEYHHKILALVTDPTNARDALYDELKKFQCFETMYFIDDPLYFSSYIDDVVDNLHGVDNANNSDNSNIFKRDIYITFIDDRLKKMYVGRHIIVDIDFDKTKYDYTNIPISNTKGFTDGNLYAKNHTERWCKSYEDNNYKEQWYAGYIYRKMKTIKKNI